MRPITELLKSTLAGHRKFNPNLPSDDLAALEGLAPAELKRFLPMLGSSLRGEEVLDATDESIFDSVIEIALACLKRLLEHQTVICCMALDSGTNLYDKTMIDKNTFWDIAAKLTELAKPQSNSGRNPFVLLITCNEGPQDHVGIKYAMSNKWYVRTTPLCEDSVAEYMSFCLNVPQHQIPKPLHDFVAKITRGNALYVRETIDQLISHAHIEVFRDSSGNSEGLYYNKDLDKIEIANWSHTAMIGGTVSLLETLDPIESAVVKMSTVFDGVFTVADLAASSCSRWAGATRFDNLRLFKAVNFLAKREIIDIVENNSEVTQNCQALQGHEQYFQLSKVLIRKVGGAMVLEAQKKAVKRQALMERVLAKDLPARMEEVQRKKKIPHIPWYYQIEMPTRRASAVGLPGLKMPKMT